MALKKVNVWAPLTEIFIKSLPSETSAKAHHIIPTLVLLLVGNFHHVKPHCGDYLCINLHSRVWIISLGGILKVVLLS